MQSNSSLGPDNLNQEEQEKKSYQRPELALYGDISELTQAVDMMGNPDGGGGMMTKT